MDKCRVYCDFCDELSDELMYCARCKTVRYCSKKCQRSDWICHKLICHPLLSERLKAICQIESEGFTGPYSRTELSRSVSYILNKELYWLNPFKKIGNDYYYCIICGKGTALTRPFYGKDFTFIFNEHKIECLRCSDCLSKKKLICGTTLMEVSVCFRKKIPIIMMLLYEHLYVCNDMIHVIINVINQVGKFCGHVTKAFRTK